jgi:subtilisin family serine protease
VNGLVAPAGPGPGFNVAPSSNAIPLTPQAASPGVGIVIGPRPAYEPGQLLVYWPDAATLDPVLARIRRDLGLSPAQRTTLARLGGVILLFETSGTAGAPALEAMRARLRAALPNIAVDFNTRYYAESGPHQYFGEHLHLPFSDGPASPVGVVDTEVGAIAALKDLRIVRRSFLSGTDVAAADIHGTAVATLIAGRDGVHDFTGAAAGAPLYVAAIMRRIGDASGTNTLLLAQALDWLLSQQVRIVNLSMGGPGDALMASLMDKAVQHAGLIVIAAAGNGGPAAPPSFPAAYPGVLAVTATNAADQVYSHANHGSYIALAAPGEDLWVPDSGEGRYVSGTSFAAALVSGLASRMLALAPGLSGAAVRQHLCVSARDLGLPGIDPVYGCGLVQAVPALGAVKSGGLMKED